MQIAPSQFVLTIALDMEAALFQATAAAIPASRAQIAQLSVALAASMDPVPSRTSVLASVDGKERTVMFLFVWTTAPTEESVFIQDCASAKRVGLEIAVTPLPSPPLLNVFTCAVAMVVA